MTFISATILSTLTAMFSTRFLGNTTGAWLLAILVTLILYYLIMGAKSFVNKQIDRHASIENFKPVALLSLLLHSTTRLFGIAISVYVGSQFLTLTQKQTHFLAVLPVIAFLLQVGIGLTRFWNTSWKALSKASPVGRNASSSERCWCR